MHIDDLFLIVGHWPCMTIQIAVNICAAAGQNINFRAVLIPPGYAGTDTFTNPSSVPIIDLRAFGPSTGLGGTLAISGGGGSSTRFSNNETPSGAVNGSNTAFTVAQTPANGGMFFLTRNGQFQVVGVDYTISGVNITYLYAPSSGDKIRATYTY
jgi:hypothetical protein